VAVVGFGKLQARSSTRVAGEEQKLAVCEREDLGLGGDAGLVAVIAVDVLREGDYVLGDEDGASLLGNVVGEETDMAASALGITLYNIVSSVFSGEFRPSGSPRLEAEIILTPS